MQETLIEKSIVLDGIEKYNFILSGKPWRSTQVGRRGAPAKGVGRVTGARVQISPSPPLFKYTFTFCKSVFIFLSVVLRNLLNTLFLLKQGIILYLNFSDITVIHF